MIPKQIHYCWFGGKPLPELAIKCIESWKKYLPDYEIKEWNESNFNVNTIPYTQEAYNAKKYAFVSDYARFWILYKYGGVYFDTDVELIRRMDDILQKGPYMGCESFLTTHYLNGALAPGLGFACEPNMSIIGKLINQYEHLHFSINGKLNPKTILAYTTEIFLQNGLILKDDIQESCGFTIYPPDYFNPLNKATNKIEATENTRSIHHYMASWESKSRINKYLRYIKYRIIIPCIPVSIIEKIVSFKKNKKEQKLNNIFRISEK